MSYSIVNLCAFDKRSIKSVLTYLLTFTNKLNNSGPNTLPCGTPLVTKQVFEKDEPSLTFCKLLVRNAWIQK